MFSMANLPGLDALRIDDRNERPIMVAFAAIVIVGAIAFALTLL